MGYGPAVNCPNFTGYVPGEPVHTCDRCENPCSKPAHFENPYYGPHGGYFNYAKWLCAEHYDEAIEGQPDMERWDEMFDGWEDDGGAVE